MKYKVKRDGIVKFESETEFEAFKWLQDNTSYSFEWAVEYEGWTIEFE
jgi:hypothetical protein